jgi:hypothetical protein
MGSLPPQGIRCTVRSALRGYRLRDKESTTRGHFDSEVLSKVVDRGVGVRSSRGRYARQTIRPVLAVFHPELPHNGAVDVPRCCLNPSDSRPTCPDLLIRALAEGSLAVIHGNTFAGYYNTAAEP